MYTRQPTLIRTTAHTERGRVLVLAGELDSYGTATISTSGNHEEARPEVLDLRRVSFVDAAGIRFLLTIAGDEPIEVLASDTVRRLVEICGLAARLRCVEPDYYSPDRTGNLTGM